MGTSEGDVDLQIQEPKLTPKKRDLLGTAREFVDSFFYDRRQRRLYEAMGVSPNSTFLLYGPPGCFSKGTKILTPSGKKNIEDANIVYSYNFDTDSVEAKPCIVVPTLKKIVEITFEDGNTINTSKDHIFYRNNRVIQSKDLNKGDYIDKYENKKLCNLWKRNKGLPLSRKFKKMLFNGMPVYLEKPKIQGKREPELQKKFSKGDIQKIQGRYVPNKIGEKIQYRPSYNKKTSKGKRLKDKKFQGTIENGNEKARDEGKKKETNGRKRKPPVQTRKESRSKTEQKKVSRSSKKEQKEEMCQLWRKGKEKRFSCSSHRWREYKQLSRKLSSFVSRMSLKTSPIKIKSIRFTEKTEEMFDLIVPGTNNFFLSNGILAHNTGKTYSISALNNTANRGVMFKRAKGEEPEIGEYNLITFPYDIGKYGTAYVNRGSRKIESFFDQALF
ncbi:MAG: hypothetical protein ACOCTT_04100, partial [archaeon]